jgi:hypothetical protein
MLEFPDSAKNGTGVIISRLHLVFVVAPIVAGADKFVLCDRKIARLKRPA